MTAPQKLDVRVAGDRLDVTLYRPTSGDLAGEHGQPCIVMAHGLGCTQDSGLQQFAEGLASTGCAVLTFDYRHFAGSEGQPRQLIDPQLQQEDYRAVIEAARALDGVDANRIVLWGVSFSGGHVIELAADDPSIAAVIALVPSTDGRAAALKGARAGSPMALVKANIAAMRDARAAKNGEPPVYLPLVARPGEVGALSAPGAYESMTTLAGPSWRNEFAARLLLKFASYRPVQKANQISCPVLMQIADLDQTASAEAASECADEAGARAHHYPCDHFDVFPGQEFYEQVLRDQQRFITDTFSGIPEPRPWASTVGSDAR